MGHLASGRFPHERWAMDDHMNQIDAWRDETARGQESGAAVLGRGGRMSRQRKSAAVLRLMRENRLLAPTRVGSARGPRAHDGTIVPETVDAMWGTDLTTTWTQEGPAAVPN